MSDLNFSLSLCFLFFFFFIFLYLPDYKVWFRNNERRILARELSSSPNFFGQVNIIIPRTRVSWYLVWILSSRRRSEFHNYDKFHSPLKLSEQKRNSVSRKFKFSPGIYLSFDLKFQFTRRDFLRPEATSACIILFVFIVPFGILDESNARSMLAIETSAYFISVTNNIYDNPKRWTSVRDVKRHNNFISSSYREFWKKRKEFLKKEKKEQEETKKKETKDRIA